VQDVRTADGE